LSEKNVMTNDTALSK